VRQVVCEAEGFDVFLEAGGHSPLIPPELVSLQIRLHRRKELLNLGELWARDFGDLLAVLSPLGHDTVEEEDEFLGEVRYVPTSLSK
jgi:hypothetical protein